jgi:hypothetical protein
MTATTTITLKPGSVRRGDEAPRPAVLLQSPYHPDLPRRAKAIGGSWIAGSGVWAFDPRQTDAVREMCADLFGIDPHGPPPQLVDVRIELAGEITRELWFAGRCVAQRYSRDSAVRLGPGVVLEAGKFASRGGSARYPEIGKADGVVLLLRDVPLPMAERERQRGPGDGVARIEILGPSEPAAAVLARVAAQAAAQAPSTTDPHDPEAEVEAIWARIQQLPEQAQVELRNRLLAAL